MERAKRIPDEPGLLFRAIRGANAASNETAAPRRRASVRPSALTRPLSSREQITWIGLGGATPIVAPPDDAGVIDG